MNFKIIELINVHCKYEQKAFAESANKQSTI